MAITLLVVRLFLAAVFLVAALAKLADLRGSRQAMLDFGVPDILAPALGTLLPLAELAATVALVLRATAWWGAIAALALLLLFIGGISYNMVRGREPDCHCFGQLRSEPIGWSTLARNGVLAVLAGFVVWQGRHDAGLSAVSWLGKLTATQLTALGAGIAGLVVLALLAGLLWMLVHVLRQQGRLLLRLDAVERQLAVGAGAAPAAAPAAPPQAAGLPVGSTAPVFALSGLYGETLTLDSLRARGKPALLLFSDPGCGPCSALLPEIGRWQQEHAATLTLPLISRGTPEANRSKATEHGITQVLLQHDREVAEAYQANGTPSAVLVRPDGTIGSPLAQGADAIRALIARTAGQPIPLPMAPVQANGGSLNGHAAPQPRPKIGDDAPTLALPDLTEKTVTLAAYRGRPTLILFWNPGCGFCQKMLDDLRAWESNAPKGAPELLVVSTGTVEANRPLGLRAPVLLDQSFGTGQAFGAGGTPMAVLIDANGKIASEVAAGADAVFALANAEPVEAR